MKQKRLLLIAAAALLAAGFSGCGKEAQRAADVVAPQPTAVPTVAATPTPTPTPAPTATPAPRVIGMKTDTAKRVMLTNNTKKDIRELYLKASGTEEWGKNLIPAESFIKVSEQVQMYYTPASKDNSQEYDSGETKASKSVFDIRISDGTGNTWEIYGAELSDMDKATIRIQEEVAYLTYMSISEKKQKDTRTSKAYEEDLYDYEAYNNENSSENNEQTEENENQNSGQQTENNGNTDIGTGTGDNNGNTDIGTGTGDNNNGNTDIGTGTGDNNNGNTDIGTGTGDNNGNTDAGTGGGENDFSYEDVGNDVDYGDGAGDDDFIWDESGEWG